MAIGDVGVLDGMLHVGDEAMFEALVIELRSRGAQHITGISSNPGETAERYGISAILADDPTLESEIADADLVVIAGGGNMSSIWPQHIVLRSTIGRLARDLGTPLVVTGQTIGPALTADDTTLVAGLLGSAALVGVREPDSLALVRGLGISDAVLNADDASFIADLTLSTAAPRSRPYCLVTLASHTADHDRTLFVARTAALLDEVATSTGLEVVFSAHFGSLASALTSGHPRGDEVMHERVRAAMTAPSVVEPVVDTATSAALARAASLVISSRYHPVVFAVSGGVPAIGLAVDDYTTTKLTGALGNFGQTSVLSAESLLDEGGSALLANVWTRRDAIRTEGQKRAVEHRLRASHWWDRVASLAAVRPRPSPGREEHSPTT